MDLKSETQTSKSITMKTIYKITIIFLIFSTFSCQKWEEDFSNFETILKNGRWKTTEYWEKTTDWHTNKTKKTNFNVSSNTYSFFSDDGFLYEIDANISQTNDSCYFTDDIYNVNVECDAYELYWFYANKTLFWVTREYYDNPEFPDMLDSVDVFHEFEIINFSEQKIILESTVYEAADSYDSEGNYIGFDTSTVFITHWELKNIK